MLLTYIFVDFISLIICKNFFILSQFKKVCCLVVIIKMQMLILRDANKIIDLMGILNVSFSFSQYLQH